MSYSSLSIQYDDDDGAGDGDYEVLHQILSIFFTMILVRKAFK